MMNEDKILELLAEYLRKTDQMMERLDKQASIWARQEEYRAKQEERQSKQEERQAKQEERQAKQDERYARQEEFRARQDRRLDMAYQVLITHSEKIEKLQLESNKLQEQTRKIELRTDATWKKFIAVTKRIATNRRKR